MKKRCKLSIIFSILILSSLFLSLTFVDAACSLGATPLGAGAKVKPGTEVLVVWNFYNLYGDRTTHITVTKTSGPDWDIRYDPAFHVEEYEVSGVVSNMSENVAIENSSVVLEIPADIPEGMDYVKHPSKDGYIPVKTLKIYISVPKNAKLWESTGFTFQAKGDCFTEPGAVIPAVATEMKVNITTTTEYSEKKVSDKKGILDLTGGVIGINLTTGLIAFAVLAVIIIIFLILKMKKKSKTNFSY
jgi:hypothetical protein